MKQKYSNKRSRFLGVAEDRTNAVLNRIRILGNCSNRQLYDYTDEEINKIFRSIDNKLEETKLKFKVQRKKNKEFRL